MTENRANRYYDIEIKVREKKWREPAAAAATTSFLESLVVKTILVL
jgi:hypothetical protein